MRSLRPVGASFALAAILVAGLLPGVASAADIFYRFEENATGNWRIVEDCGDGTTSTTLVTVIGGVERESPDLDDADEFVNVRILNFATCDGEFVNVRGDGPADYEGSASLQTASVEGTITLRDGSTATVDVSWNAVGPLETTINTTQFSGFSGIFTGKERDAVATGTVVVDGVELLNGASSVSGSIETLEDRNISTGR